MIILSVFSQQIENVTLRNGNAVRRSGPEDQGKGRLSLEAWKRRKRRKRKRRNQPENEKRLVYLNHCAPQGAGREVIPVPCFVQLKQQSITAPQKTKGTGKPVCFWKVDWQCQEMAIVKHLEPEAHMS